MTGEMVLTADFQRDEVNAAKLRKTKKKYIVILALKTDMPPILGGLGEGKK